jgi:hypothetical protein
MKLVTAASPATAGPTFTLWTSLARPAAVRVPRRGNCRARRHGRSSPYGEPRAASRRNSHPRAQEGFDHQPAERQVDLLPPHEAAATTGALDAEDSDPTDQDPV